MWALGVMLYEMATGARPFKGNTPFELSAAILSDEPVPVPAHLRPELRRQSPDAWSRIRGGATRRAVDVRAALDGVQTAVAALPSAFRARAVPSTDASSVVTADSQPSSRAVAGRRRARRRRIRAWPGGASDRATATVRSLAVLPLANTAGDEDLEYLCDGIAESLIQQVSKLSAFRVRPLGVGPAFKGPSADPQAAGRQLGVETVLAGTLERQVARLLISARLIDVATGRQLWANTYDRDAAELLDGAGRDRQRDHGRWPARAIDEQRA